MSEEQKKLTRYNISPVGLGEINMDVDDDGEFVYYDDVSLTADQRAKVIRLCEKIVNNSKCDPCDPMFSFCKGCLTPIAKQLLEELQ